jgi:hypothetical protein
MRLLTHQCHGLDKLIELGYVRVSYPDIDDKGESLLVELVGPGTHNYCGKQMHDAIAISYCPCCGERFYWGPTRFSQNDEACVVLGGR